MPVQLSLGCSAPVSPALTYVRSNIHDNIAVVDLDAFLQVALLINNLIIDEHGLRL